MEYFSKIEIAGVVKEVRRGFAEKTFCLIIDTLEQSWHYGFSALFSDEAYEYWGGKIFTGDSIHLLADVVPLKIADTLMATFIRVRTPDMVISLSKE